jgi:hypothetical protein
MDNTINSLVSQSMATGGTATNSNIIDKLTQQILATSDPRQWSGQGFGSAQANAADMAKIIAATGATDISQFGQITKQVPTYSYDDNGNQTQTGTSEVSTYGNKLTGQEVGNTYSERQTGNAFGGTFAGSGNTGYRVNFDDQGKPQFYTTGASSSDFKDYAPLLAIGGLAFGIPGLGELGAGLGAEAGLTAADLAIGGGSYGAGSTLGSLGSLTAGLTPELIAAGELGLPSVAQGTALGSLTAGLTPEAIAAGELGLPSATGLAPTAAGSLTAGLTPTQIAASELALPSASASSLLGAGSALGTTLGQGLGLSALGTGLGAIANQSGISNARDLINQYGTKAEGNLARSYADAQKLNVANRAGLASNYAKTQNKLGNIYDQQVEFQQPYQDVGRAGSQALVENVPYFNKQFGTADLYSGLAPNYEFMLGQGQMANQRAGNMAGGALGGNALQGLQRYTQDYAGNAYQQAFKNFQDQRQNIYGNLSDMSKIGLNSSGYLANLGNTYGSNLAGLSSNYGNNLTTSYGQGIGAANAYGLNTANLATGIGGALASNATASGANTSTALSNLGNAALFGSMLKAT